MSHRTAAALIISFMLAACDGSGIQAPLKPAVPQRDILNGPPQLQYVMRFETRVLTGWADLEHGTAIIIGAPDVPTQSRICGGPQRAQFMPVMLVGDFNSA